jgi:hypothetical protein
MTTLIVQHLGAHLVLAIMVVMRGNILTPLIRFLFEKNYSHRALEEWEHRFIQSLSTIKPFGINSANPFGLPILDPSPLLYLVLQILAL